MYTREALHAKIRDEALINVRQSGKVTLAPDGKVPNWYFDFRTILFDKEFLETVGACFWDMMQRTHLSGSILQIGGLESASLPLITGCVLSGDRATGFYVRKSRKKKMEMKQIEGTLTDAPIVLVDDLINSGSSFEKQIAILEKEGKKVSALFVIVRFRDMEAYKALTDRGIQILSLFTLPDFGIALEVKRGTRVQFSQSWYFGPAKPHFFSVGRKSQPVFDKGQMYLFSDSGYSWCLDSETGNVLWSQKMMWRVRSSERTFSDPHLYKGRLFTGASNGTLYVQDARTGRILMTESVGENIVARPEFSDDGMVVMCGMNNRHGKWEGVVTGFSTEELHKQWEHVVDKGISSNFVRTATLLVCGSGSGRIVALAPDTGVVRWSAQVCASAVGDGVAVPWRASVVFVTRDGSLCELRTTDGRIVRTISVAQWLVSAPYVIDQYAFVSSLDKCVYCINLDTGTVVWERETRGRIFSSPVVHNSLVYVGTNEGILHAYDMQTGAEVGHHVVTERITNPVVVSDARVFVATFAQEIYCLDVSLREGEG